MSQRVKVAVVGVGNNVSALVQGIALYRATGSLVGIRRPVLDGLGVGDIDFLTAFATSPEKIGRDLCEAIFLPPNNFPRLTAASARRQHRAGYLAEAAPLLKSPPGTSV